MKIEVNRFYKTRDGRKVRIYAVDGGGNWPIHGAIYYIENTNPHPLHYNKYWEINCWTAIGLIETDGSLTGCDIVSEWEEPEQSKEEILAVYEKRRELFAVKPKEKKPRMLAYLRLRDDAETMELFFRPIHRDQVTQEVLDAFTNRAPWLDSPEEE